MFDMAPSSTDFVDSTTFDPTQQQPATKSQNGPITDSTISMSPDTNGLHPLSSTTTLGSPTSAGNPAHSSSATLVTLTANNSHLGSFEFFGGFGVGFGGGGGVGSGSAHLHHSNNPLGVF